MTEKGYQIEDTYRRAIDAAGAVPYILDHATFTFAFMGEGILSMTGYSAPKLLANFGTNWCRKPFHAATWHT